jgi:hypothetical protein
MLFAAALRLRGGGPAPTVGGGWRELTDEDLDPGSRDRPAG